jgi:hypothetical protein
MTITTIKKQKKYRMIFAIVQTAKMLVSKNRFILSVNLREVLINWISIILQFLKLLINA